MKFTLSFELYIYILERGTYQAVCCSRGIYLFICICILL